MGRRFYRHRRSVCAARRIVQAPRQPEIVQSSDDEKAEKKDRRVKREEKEAAEKSFADFPRVRQKANREPKVNFLRARWQF